MSTNDREEGRWSERLARREQLRLRPERGVGIKRDVHNLDVDAPVERVIAAFESVMIDPSRRFGLITVRRPAHDQGKPFRVGHRFQGRYSLTDAVIGELRGALRGVLDECGNRLFASVTLRRLVRWIEDGHLSDYGVITERDSERFRYEYLEGSPIAGSSTFEFAQLPGDQCRVTQIFEYQELSPHSVFVMSTSVIRLHNGVVYSQVRQAAESIGARIVRTDIPDAYQVAAAEQH